MLGLKLIHVSKRGYWCPKIMTDVTVYNTFIRPPLDQTHCCIDFCGILNQNVEFIIPPHTTKLLGEEGILVSLRPSVRPYLILSIRPSVRQSVFPASRVRSVAPTVLLGSISYLYISSSNFRGCVACFWKFFCKISKFGIFLMGTFHFVLIWLWIWCEAHLTFNKRVEYTIGYCDKSYSQYNINEWLQHCFLG